MKEADCNPLLFKHLHPPRFPYSWAPTKLIYPEPSPNLCKELQFCDFPEVLYLVSGATSAYARIERDFSPGKYLVTWRLALDDNAALTDIYLNVFDSWKNIVAKELLTQNELKVMKGKGWFVHTMKEAFSADQYGKMKIVLQGRIGEKMSGLWIDWVRVVNKQNKTMTSYLKKEASLELTIQKMQESKRSKRK